MVACRNPAPDARAKADLRDLTAAHAALESSAREARSDADVRIRDLVCEARLRAFQLESAQVGAAHRGMAAGLSHRGVTEGRWQRQRRPAAS